MDNDLIRLSFIKTFVNTSRIMMQGLEIEEARDMRFWRVAKDVAELYPSLQLAAMELNRKWGFNLNIPAGSSRGAFEKAEDFYRLYSDILEQAKNNESFSQAKILFNPNGKKFEQKADDLADWVAHKGNELDRYWLNKNVLLAVSFAREMRDIAYSDMLNAFLEKHLAEKIGSAVALQAGIVNTKIEDIRNVLSKIAQKVSSNSGFVSEKKVKSELLKQFHEDCNWDSKNEAVGEIVGEFVKPFTQIVSENREKYFYYNRNLDVAAQVRDDFYNVMTEDAYFQLERQKRMNQQLGLESGEISLPNRYQENKIFDEHYDLDGLETIVPPFKVGSEDAFWEAYEEAENVQGDLKVDVENVISQLVFALDDDLLDVVTDLRDLEASSDAYDDEDDEHFSGLEKHSSNVDDFDLKSRILSFAGDVLDVAAVVKSYYGIELNDTPVDRNVVREFKADGYWDDFTYSSLNMLFNAFDAGLSENQGRILFSKTPRVEAVNEVLSLPQSLEKRNLLKLFYKGLSVTEKDALENKKQEEDYAAEDFLIYHKDDYTVLLDELRWGKEIFPKFTDEKIENWAYDINRGVVLTQIVPIYDDKTPKADETQKVLSGIENFQKFSKDEQKYIEAIVRRYSDRVVKTHNKVLDEGDFDRGLFDDVEALHENQQYLDDVVKLKNEVLLARREEESVYKRFRAFRKAHLSRQQMLMQALKQQRFCNN